LKDNQDKLNRRLYDRKRDMAKYKLRTDFMKENVSYVLNQLTKEIRGELKDFCYYKEEMKKFTFGRDSKLSYRPRYSNNSVDSAEPETGLLYSYWDRMATQDRMAKKVWKPIKGDPISDKGKSPFL